MWQKKEDGRMYTGQKVVHLQHGLAVRTKMMDGMAKKEDNKKEGRHYASGRHVKEGNIEGGEQPARKKVKCNHSLTSTLMECKCRAQDHRFWKIMRRG
jgi:hypothetical protein